MIGQQSGTCGFLYSSACVKVKTHTYKRTHSHIRTSETELTFAEDQTVIFTTVEG